MKMRILVEATIAAVLGFCAVAVTTVLQPSYQPYGTWLFSYFGEIVEKMNHIAFPLLTIIGFVIAYFGKAKPWIIGASTMALFPVISFIDMVAGSIYGRSDHNLFPIEWLIYGLISVFGIAGALCGRFLRNRLEHPTRRCS